MNNSPDSSHCGQCAKIPCGTEARFAQLAVRSKNSRKEAESKCNTRSINSSFNLDSETNEKCKYSNQTKVAPTKTFYKSAAKLFKWRFNKDEPIPADSKPKKKKTSKKMSQLAESFAASIAELSGLSIDAISDIHWNSFGGFGQLEVLGNLSEEVFKPRKVTDSETNLGVSSIFNFNEANNLAPAASRRRSSLMSLTRDHYPAVVKLINPSRGTGSFLSRESLSLGSIGDSLSLSRNGSLVGYGGRSSSMDIYGKERKGTFDAIRELMIRQSFLLDTIDCEEEESEYQNEKSGVKTSNDVDTYYLVGKRDSLSIYHEKKIRNSPEACGKIVPGTIKSSVCVDVQGNIP